MIVPGKRGANATWPGASHRALDAREQPAAGMRVHRDAVAHPRHLVRLADDPFAPIEIDRDRLHHRS
jgi:hypothetical protein